MRFSLKEKKGNEEKQNLFRTEKQLSFILLIPINGWQVPLVIIGYAPFSVKLHNYIDSLPSVITRLMPNFVLYLNILCKSFKFLKIRQMLKEKSPKQCLICKNLFITNDVGIWGRSREWFGRFFVLKFPPIT